MTKPREDAGAPSLDSQVETVPTIEAHVDAAMLDESADHESFRLIGIDAVRAPEGCAGSDWHIYRIVQGENGITGYRRGELARVRADVEDIVTAKVGEEQDDFNEPPPCGCG